MTPQNSKLTNSAIGLLKGKKVNLTTATAWYEGTNILTALRICPEIVRMWLLKEVGRLVREVDANKTIRDNDELTECCDAILEDHPTIKIEEVAHCFQLIKRGKLLPKIYERLKTKEILDALRQYEGELRAEVMERTHEAKMTDPFRRSSEGQTLRDHLHLTEQDLIDLGTVKPKQSDTRTTDSDSNT